MVGAYANFRSRIFKEADLKRAEDKISEIEKSTSGEIVIMSVRQARSYSSIHLAWALGGWAFASALGLASSQVADWPLPPKTFLSEQAFGIFIGYVLPFIPWVKRLSLTPWRRGGSVHREALAKFSETGLHRTRLGTGILIYIAELEHRVEILADYGIHSKVESGFWDQELKLLIDGIRNRKAGDAILVVLDQMGKKLAEHFPPDPENPNELSNQILSS